MRLAICLISADRYDYTKKTVESFEDYNTRLFTNPDIKLYHADDASDDTRIHKLAAHSGFQLVVGTAKGSPRRGGQAMRRGVINHAAKNGCSHVLLLENDWESVRPLPLETIEKVFRREDIYCMRLYGTYKEQDENGVGRRACGKTHYGKGKNSYDPNWVPMIGCGEEIEVGDIHWGAPPAVTRIAEAVWLHEGTRSEGHIRRKCASMTQLTARPLHNVFFHIGAARTPEFVQ